MVFDFCGAPLTENLPGSHSRSFSLTSSRCAASFLALSRILRAASAQAAPEVGVERLAYVPKPDASRSTPTSGAADRKSTRLNSSHANRPYAVLCLQTKKKADASA